VSTEQLSLEEQAAMLSNQFREIIGSAEFINTARDWAEVVMHILLGLEEDVEKRMPPGTLDRVHTRMAEAARTRYNDELRLAALAVAAAGLLVSDGRGGKLSLDAALERAANYHESLRRLVRLTHERGEPVEITRQIN
jgi:hypothetical protein